MSDLLKTLLEMEDDENEFDAEEYDTDFDGEEIDGDDEGLFPESYWEAVGAELSKLASAEFSLYSFDYDGGSENRTIAYMFGSNSAVLTITHNWRNDGTESKPVTYLSLEDETGEMDEDDRLGRFAIWSGKPEDYADDIWDFMTNHWSFSVQ